MKNIPKLLSTIFYIGCLPRFQATIASILGLLVYQILFAFTGNDLFRWLLFLVPLFICLLAVYYYQTYSVSEHDPKEIVADEFFAAALIPFFFYENLIAGIAALVLFRVIDLAKPGFIKKIDEWKSWMSIYVDDFVAALAGIAVVKIAIFVITLL